jgi:hypothetical protein
MKSTKNIKLAAAYLALGAKHEKTDRTDSRNMEFFFSPKSFDSPILAEAAKNVEVQNLESIESAWINKTLMVNAYEYADAYERIKSIIHSR